MMGIRSLSKFRL